MGSFAANAQAAIVPVALYMVYHTMVPKNMDKKMGGLIKKMTRKTRKNRS
jgi:predicted Na+-dependent transporter